MTEQTLDPMAGFVFNEAPASLNFYGVTRKGWNVQFTLRDSDERNLMQRFVHFSNWLEEKGVSPKPVGQQPAATVPSPEPTLDPAARLALEEGNKQLAGELQTQAEAVPTSDYDEYLDFARLVIAPQPDDRVNLEFYASGHKFADVKVSKWRNAQAAGLLKYVTSADVTKPGDYTVTGRVYWKRGKEYQPGKHYKDVTHARLI